jgi:ATP synthase protein I
MSDNSGFSQGLSIALRFGIEMVVATGLGGLMGYALDDFFDSKPWCLVVGVFFGGAAGALNVYYAAMQLTFEDNNDDKNNDDLS